MGVKTGRAGNLVSRHRGLIYQEAPYLLWPCAARLSPLPSREGRYKAIPLNLLHAAC